MIMIILLIVMMIVMIILMTDDRDVFFMDMIAVVLASG